MRRSKVPIAILLIAVVSTAFPVRPARAAGEGRPAAVVAIHSQDTNPWLIAAWAKKLREKLTRLGMLAVATEEATRRKMALDAVLPDPTLKLEEVSAQIKSAAFEIDRGGDFEGWESRLVQLVEILRNKIGDTPEKWGVLRHAQAVLAEVYLRGGHPENALAVYQEMLRPDPSISLPEKEVSPQEEDYFSRAREIVEGAPRGRLDLASEPPGALAVVNGRALGKTPITLELPCGNYHVTLMKEGRHSLRRKATVCPGPARISADTTFESSLLLWRGPGFLARRQTDAELFNDLLRLGRRMRVERLITVSGGSTAGCVVGRLIDVERGSTLRAGSVPPRWDEVPDADVEVLARFLATGEVTPPVQPEEGRLEVAKIPAVEEMPAVAAGKPWYKRWWVWAIVGGVVVGGTVATIALTRDEQQDGFWPTMPSPW